VAPARYRLLYRVRHRRLVAALACGLVAGMLVVELVAAWLTGSLSLLSDAGHLATDLAGLLAALAAIRIAAAARPTRTLTYGWHRLEILAALGNSLLLVGIAGYVAFEGVRRLGQPPDLAGLPLVLVAAVGLTVNLVTARLLREGATESLNLEGARLEVLADAVGSAAVLTAGAVIVITGWTPIDALVALSKLGANALYMNTGFAAPQFVEVVERERPVDLERDRPIARWDREVVERVRTVGALASRPAEAVEWHSVDLDVEICSAVAYRGDVDTEDHIVVVVGAQGERLMKIAIPTAVDALRESFGRRLSLLAGHAAQVERPRLGLSA
jgi:cation diffusion facilitator family transporter